MKRTIPFILPFIALLFWACHERIIVYPPSRVPDTSSQTVAVSSTAPDAASASTSTDQVVPMNVISSLGRLDSGEINFRMGKYTEAIQDYEAYLENNPQSLIRDRILFNIGLSRALTPGTTRNLAGAEIILKELVSEFPESGYKSPAELILSLISEVKQLNQDVNTRNARINRLQEELTRLKEIDLKRRPSRPE